ncbi:helix-turn-helix domain-containing protein [Prosthecodimorpha hirschii]|uniref:helix-turn-helix domain-containing protein n=1 Tax=Prosthecodimorpha hirschii TaxID=665126 RepID=UPI0015E4474D|nr:helix-turn-helix domain-containing protein [Prosthecomicrobium hirschii]
MTPLAWPDLVAEALRRRKAEGLTQRNHAALAGVSIPTMAAFERGETTLTLAKAFDILRVVGLLDERPPEDAQDRFVREAMARWRDLTADLPKESPARFPHGWYRFDYELVGDLENVTISSLRNTIEKGNFSDSIMPILNINSLFGFKNIENDEYIEVFLNPKYFEKINENVYNLLVPEFGRVSSRGNAIFIRAYSEDLQNQFAPRRIFDTTEPIRKISKTILQARDFSRIISCNHFEEIIIKFRALYSGLYGRVLKDWTNPIAGLSLEGHPASSDEVTIQVNIPVNEVPSLIAEHVHPLVVSLYERFGERGPSLQSVKAEVAQVLSRRAL